MKILNSPKSLAIKIPHLRLHQLCRIDPLEDEMVGVILHSVHLYQRTLNPSRPEHFRKLH